jgi:hypothetical protein
MTATIAAASGVIRVIFHLKAVRLRRRRGLRPDYRNFTSFRVLFRQSVPSALACSIGLRNAKSRSGFLRG